MTDRFAPFVLSLAVAAAYVITGRLGLELAIPPGYATAVWPPSGIALAALLLGGLRLWPGVLLGSFLVNLSTGFDAASTDALWRSLLVPFVIASGATMQALGGAVLVKRFGNFPNPLRTVPQIAGLLVLGGMAGCTISASIGVTTLFVAGVVPLAATPFTWLTWWGGDTIGVFVFTPLVLAMLMRPRADWDHRATIIVTATIATFALGVGLVAYTSQLDRREFDTQLTDRGKHLGISLENTVTARLHAVGALQAFLAHDDAISPEGFARFSSNLRVHIPGILALEWIARVPAQQRGQMGFEITESSPAGPVPAGKRAEYYPITYVEPAGANRHAMGFDIATADAARMTLVQARNSGMIAVSGRLALVQGGDAVLAVASVHRGGKDWSSRDDRQEHLAGYALGIFHLTDLTKAAFHSRDLSDIQYWLVDETNSAAPVVLSTNTDQPPSPFILAERGLFGGSGSLDYRHVLEVGGRRWVLQVAPTQEFIAKHRQQNAWVVLIGGLLAAGLMGAFAMVVTGREGELRRVVDDRTHTLETALTQLGSSEERYRVLFSGSMVPMLLVDPATGAIVDANYAASTYYGYGLDVLKGMRITQINILSPGEVAAEMMRARNAGANHFHFRHRLANGDIRDVEVHSGPVEMIGRTLLYSIVHDITERRRLEAERRRLVMAVEQSPASVVITDPAGAIEYVNPAFTSITGYTLAEVMGQNPRLLKSGETSDAEYRTMWADLAEGKPWTGLFHNRRKDGTYYWEQAQISPVMDNDGHITNYLAIKENITERKQTEEALARLNRQLKDILAAASEVAIIATDETGIITLFNRGAERMLGYESKAVVCKHSPALFHAHDEIRGRGQDLSQEWGYGIEDFRVFAEIAERDGREVRDWTYVRADGRRLTVSLAVTPVRSDDGRITGYLGVAQDITERKSAEQQLERQAARYQFLLKTAGDGIHVLDKDGTLIEASDSFWHMLGYTPANHPQSLNVRDWDAAISLDNFSELLLKFIATPAIFETKHRRANGSVFDVEISCHGVEFEGQSYLYAASRDITARKALEGELRRSNAELEQFAYVTSHDLRQPLRMVSSYMTLIERHLKDQLTDDTRQFMAFARDGAKKMDRLILDLLDYSRVGRLGAPPEPLALGEVVEEALQNLSVAITEAQATITVPPDLPVLTGRRSDLIRLFQNLIGNAVKYRAADRTAAIALSCARDGDFWTISVHDNGIGIPADQTERVFGVFQRLHTAEQYEGTGIGLAISRKVVEHHGGHIWVESTEGQGSVFRFTLPVESRPTDEA